MPSRCFYGFGLKPAERAKGSTASVRPVATGAAHRVGESILLRRWKRLHRAAAQCEAEAGGDAPLTHSQVRHWTSLLAGLPLPVNQSHAIQMANAAIMEEDARLKQEQAKLWRNRFKRASTDALRAGAGALKVAGPHDPDLSSESMTADWEPIWTRPSGNGAQAWDTVCQATSWPPAELGSSSFSAPTSDQLAAAIKEGSGEAGFDELKGLAIACPWLVVELAELMHACMFLQDEAAIGACQDRFFSWRVVGIPKRCEAAARPIAIASAVVRSWNRALLAQFPPPPEGQYCGSPGHSAVSATLAWLRAPCVRGAELDLRKAFDSVLHDVAFCAGASAGVARAVLDYMRRMVWGAPRHCIVYGEAPQEVVRASCGLPAGDPCSPAFLSFVMGPWAKLAKAFPGVEAFLYMDDRSLVDNATPPSLNAALDATQWFDHTLGLTEHAGKRQVWDRQDPGRDHRVEHLGIKALHKRAELPELRVCFDQVCSLASGVELLPGRMEVREHLLLGLVMPKLLWSAPLVPEIPNTVVSAFFKAMRGHVTWWCKGRVWADHITLHPQFAASSLLLPTRDPCPRCCEHLSLTMPRCLA